MKLQVSLVFFADSAASSCSWFKCDQIYVSYGIDSKTLVITDGDEEIRVHVKNSTGVFVNASDYETATIHDVMNRIPHQVWIEKEEDD